MRLTRTIAAMQLALIIPAALFLLAVLTALGRAPQYDLARLAHRVVAWYSARTWTLWLFLLTFPFAVLIAGCATLSRRWNYEGKLPHASHHSFAMASIPFATLAVAGMTLASAGILVVVVLHMLAN